MDYYNLLGLDRTCNVEQIKTQYRLLARANHPDVSDGDKESANQRMRDLNEAYEVLSSPTLRRQYDAQLNAAGSQSGTTSPAGAWGSDHHSPSPGFDQQAPTYTYVWDKRPSYWTTGLPMNWVIRVAIMFACFVLLPKLEHRASERAQVASERQANNHQLAFELQFTNSQTQSRISDATADQQVFFRELSSQSTIVDLNRRAHIVEFSADLESLRRLSTQMTADEAEVTAKPATLTDAESDRIQTEITNAFNLGSQVERERFALH